MSSRYNTTCKQCQQPGYLGLNSFECSNAAYCPDIPPAVTEDKAVLQVYGHIVGPKPSAIGTATPRIAHTPRVPQVGDRYTENASGWLWTVDAVYLAIGYADISCSKASGREPFDYLDTHFTLLSGHVPGLGDQYLHVATGKVWEVKHIIHNNGTPATVVIFLNAQTQRRFVVDLQDPTIWSLLTTPGPNPAPSGAVPSTGPSSAP